MSQNKLFVLALALAALFNVAARKEASAQPPSQPVTLTYTGPAFETSDCGYPMCNAGNMTATATIIPQAGGGSQVLEYYATANGTGVTMSMNDFCTANPGIWAASGGASLSLNTDGNVSGYTFQAYQPCDGKAPIRWLYSSSSGSYPQDWGSRTDGSGNWIAAGATSSLAGVGSWTNTKGLGQQCCVNSTADPIAISSGNVFESVADYETVGQNKLAFVRSYNSLGGILTSAASLGGNWRSNYDCYLRVLSSSAVIVERPDGRQIGFDSAGSTWTPDSDVDLRLTNSGSTWTLTDGNDTTEIYTAAGSEAFLQSIKLRNGYTQTLSYTNGNLISVSDSYGRSLVLAYTNNLLHTVTTSDRLVLTYGYAAITGGNQLTSVSYNTSPATSLTYLYENASFPFALTGITDENGHRTATWGYDGSGRAISNCQDETPCTNTSPGYTTIAYDDSGTGNRTVTHPLGEQDIYKFTPLQGVSKVTEIDRAAYGSLAAATRIIGYDANGYVNSATDWNGNTTTYTNNSYGLPTTTVEASGSPIARTTVITYDATWPRLPHVIATPGLTTTLNYDSATGNLLTRVDKDTTTQTVPYSTNGQSRTTAYTYTTTGQLQTMQLPRTDVTAKTTYTYTTGALTGIVDALGHATSISAHTAGGLPLMIVDPNSVTTTLTYDTRNHLKTSAVAMAAGTRMTTFGYDAAENLTSVALPGGASLTNTYDNAHRLKTVTDLLAQSANYTLDEAGNATAVALKNSSGATRKTHASSFDAADRMLTDTGGASQQTKYTLDGNGNPTSITDPMNNPATMQVFDALNRLHQITDRAAGMTTIGYDAHDRPLSVATPNGATTSYVYDGFGEVIEESSPDRGTTIYHYDADGNLGSKTDALSIVANYTYDALDRRTGIAYPADMTQNVTYRYDQTGHGKGVGRLTSMTDPAGTFSRSYDERGAITVDSHTHGSYTLANAYGYDAAGYLTSLTYPSGMVLTQTRDSMERITGVTLKPTSSGASQTVIASIAYAPFGPLTGFTYGNGITSSHTLDGDYRVTNVTDSNSTQNLTYALNANDNVIGIADAVTGTNSQTLTYDALDRLKTAKGGYGSETFGYDANGNRNSFNGASWTYSAHSNRLTAMGTTAVTANVNGNITGIASSPAIGFTYNKANRLATVTSGGATVLSYVYDGFGQRIAKVDTAQRFQVYDALGRYIEQTDNTDNVKLDYIYLNGMPVATFVPNGSTGTLSFLHDDRLGTPRRATSSTKAVGWNATVANPFDAPNTPTAGNTIANDLRMPGQEYELGSGQNHNGWRDYAPALGRYLESDPIGLRGGLNSYAYAGSNPANNTDPTGEDWKDLLRVTYCLLAVCNPSMIDSPNNDPMQTSVSQGEHAGFNPSSQTNDPFPEKIQLEKPNTCPINRVGDPPQNSTPPSLPSFENDLQRLNLLQQILRFLNELPGYAIQPFILLPGMQQQMQIIIFQDGGPAKA